MRIPLIKIIYSKQWICYSDSLSIVSYLRFFYNFYFYSVIIYLVISSSFSIVFFDSLSIHLKYL